MESGICLSASRFYEIFWMNKFGLRSRWKGMKNCLLKLRFWNIYQKLTRRSAPSGQVMPALLRNIKFLERRISLLRNTRFLEPIFPMRPKNTQPCFAIHFIRNICSSFVNHKAAYKLYRIAEHCPGMWIIRRLIIYIDQLNTA